jgi:hypothetical protein
MRGGLVSDPVGAAYAVTCQTCKVQVWQGDIPPADGQVLVTAYADSVPGTACPSKVDPCPNKSAAVAAAVATEKRTRPAAILARIASIEAKIGIVPPPAA